MRKYLLFLISIHLGASCLSQEKIASLYSADFQAAYSAYPNIPDGMLEAVSMTQTRMRHIEGNNQSCTGIPQVKGIMGLTEDGQGYFKDNLDFAADISGYSVHEIKTDPSKNIMAYAAAYNSILTELSMDMEDWGTHELVLQQLSEIPLDDNPTNHYAVCAFTYQVMRWLNDESFQFKHSFDDPEIDLIELYGEENYNILSGDMVTITDESVEGEKGESFDFKSLEYGPALWVSTPTCNYSSRAGTPISAVTIHTIQGTYSGAISWANNCISNVSYHYVARSSDGQITQMLYEIDKGWHVGSHNPYTIGIEHEGYVDDASWYTVEMITSSADLVKDITESGYGINPLRTFQGPATAGTNLLGSCITIKGHQHFAGVTHTDPGINWPWEWYYQLLNDGPDTNIFTSNSGSVSDSGGSTGNYSDDERELYLIQPVAALNITLSIAAFSLEEDWDYLRIYDGATNSDPLIGTYTGTSIPSTITSTGGSILLDFRTDCATTDVGFDISWTSIPGPLPGDVIAPTTTVSVTGSEWQTTDFTADFTDVDNVDGTGVKYRFWQAIDFDGTEWRANNSEGFYSDNFDEALHADWSMETGSWNTTSDVLEQTDEGLDNTNVWSSFNQDDHDVYLYHWSQAIGGGGSNKRGGFHFMCDDPTLLNRGNSYFVWFRSDNDKIQIYKTVSDVFTLEADIPFVINDGQWYDVKTIYDKNQGTIEVWVDNVYAASWLDSAPYTSGNSISFRSGNSNYQANNLKVYRLRTESEAVTVGPSQMIRYQNPDPLTPSAKIKSIAVDSSANISLIASEYVNVDWTVPDPIPYLNDGTGADIVTTETSTQLSANWGTSFDPNSDIARYWYAIGTSPGATDVVDWTDNWYADTITHTGLSLTYGTTYYFSVFAENGAGLYSDTISSNGQLLVVPTAPPVAGFVVYSSWVCETDSIQFENSSTDAVTYDWSIPGAIPPSSTDINPYFFFPVSGTYEVTLVATGPGGVDTYVQSLSVESYGIVNSSFAPSIAVTSLSDPFITFSNYSDNANGYLWDFGDGSTSTDFEPWHEYTAVGIYTVMLVAVNGTCPNDTSYLEVQITEPIGLDENPNAIVEVYPNPIESTFFVNVGSDWLGEKVTLELLDSRGRVLEQKIFDPIQNQEVIELTAKYESGIYFLRLKTADLLHEQKILIKK